MSISRETNEVFYRPTERRLVNLSNEELRALYEMRAKKVAENIDPKGFWDDPRIIYWNSMMRVMMDLYEVLLEIQARYPMSEICQYAKEENSGGGYYKQLIPLKELPWMKVAQYEYEREQKMLERDRRHKLRYGLKELPKDE